MVKKIQVLVVDDSAFMRVLISDMINECPEIEVIGTARNGIDGVSKASTLQPDVITMDVEMPKMDGISAVKSILSERKVPIIMLSALTKKGADVTIKALELGAFDFVTKPSGTISLDIEIVKSILWSKIKDAYINKDNILANLDNQSPITQNLTIETKNHLDFSYGSKSNNSLYENKNSMGEFFRGEFHKNSPNQKFSQAYTYSENIVVIGASTGGPKALHEIFSEISQDLNACVLVVQHMPPFFTQSLSERLDRVSGLNVKEGSDQDLLINGSAFVAPGDYHMGIRSKKILLNKDPPMHAIRPAIDVTMESVALNYGQKVIGVVLTGMGRDGAIGLSAIKKAGGTTIACDEKTSVIFGMPKEAINTGCVDHILPLYRIARKIQKLVDNLCI